MANGRAKGPLGEQPFDRWLHKQLHAIYDEVANAPLPDLLVEIDDKDQGKRLPGTTGQ